MFRIGGRAYFCPLGRELPSCLYWVAVVVRVRIARIMLDRMSQTCTLSRALVSRSSSKLIVISMVTNTITKSLPIPFPICSRYCFDNHNLLLLK